MDSCRQSTGTRGSIRAAASAVLAFVFMFVFMFIVICSSPATVGAAVNGGATFLGPLPYLCQDDSPFADVSECGPVYLETTEDLLLNTPGVSASAVKLIGPGGLTDSVDCDDGQIDGSGTLGRSIFSGDGNVGITFTFDAVALGGLPTHAGIVWTDGGGTANFQAFGPGNVPIGSIGPVPIGDSSNSGTTDEDRFFGVINDAGVLRITITNNGGGIEVDHLQYGTPAAASRSGGTIPGDLDDNGVVNAADLGSLLVAWGPCPSGCCTADLNASGEVDAADLGMLLSNWT
jgi:hypothetical protein